MSHYCCKHCHQRYDDCTCLPFKEPKMPCHPLEPFKCPSCGCREGELHLDACAIHRLPGAKRQIVFAPTPEVKAAVPYTPGPRQAKAEIPRRINLDEVNKVPLKDPLKDTLDYLGQEFVKVRKYSLSKSNLHDQILKTMDALHCLIDLMAAENKT